MHCANRCDLLRTHNPALPPTTSPSFCHISCSQVTMGVYQTMAPVAATRKVVEPGFTAQRAHTCCSACNPAFWAPDTVGTQAVRNEYRQVGRPIPPRPTTEQLSRLRRAKMRMARQRRPLSSASQTRCDEGTAAVGSHTRPWWQAPSVLSVYIPAAWAVCDSRNAGDD